MLSPIRPDQRWMIQFILNQNIQIRRQLERKIIRQMRGIISPRQRDDLHRIALRTQIFHHHAVVHIPAAEGVDGAVDDEADFHGV